MLRGKPLAHTQLRHALDDLESLLQRVENPVQRGDLAAAVLRENGAQVVLLQLLAAALRVEAPREEDPAQTELVVHGIACWALLIVGNLIDALLPSVNSDAAIAARVDAFVRVLVCTETLQAASRQLADAADVLAAWAGSGQQRPVPLVLRTNAAYMLRSVLHLARNLQLYAGEAEASTEAAPLLAALRGSNVVEHAARLLMLNESLPPPQPSQEPVPGRIAGLKNVQRLSSVLLCKLVAHTRVLFAKTGLAINSVSGAQPAAAGPAAGAASEGSVHGAPASQGLTDTAAPSQFGLCTRHAVIAAGLTVLGASDGRGLQGLPPFGLTSPTAGLDITSDGNFCAVMGLIAAVGEDQAAPQRCLSRRAAVQLLLRTGQNAEEALAAQGREASMWVGQPSAAASSHVGGNSPAAQMHPSTSSCHVVLLHMGTLALGTALPLVFRGAELPAERQAEGAACWRLAFGLLPQPEQAHMKAEAQCHLLGHLFKTLADLEPEQHSHPAALAATDGGLALGLERLLRYSGRDPRGHAAMFLRQALSAHRSGYPWLFPLLAYCPPRHIAALAATLAKLMRRAEPHHIPVGLRVPLLAELLLEQSLGLLLVVADAPGGAGPGGPGRAQLLALVHTAVRLLPELSWTFRAAAAVMLSRQDAAPDTGAGAAAETAADSHDSTSDLSGASRAQIMSLLATCWSTVALVRVAALSCFVPEPAARGSAPAPDGGDASSSPAASLELEREAFDAWRALLGGEDVGAVPLLGAALCLLERLGPEPLGEQELPFLRILAEACCAVAALFPLRVHEAALDRSDRRPPASAVFHPWRPEALQLLSLQMRARGIEAGLVLGVEELARARQQGSWEGWQGGKVALSAQVWAQSQVLCSVLPCEAWAVLPSCSNPACKSLAGDSELEMKLRHCGRCGWRSYCCRECQTEHWRAGHKEECALRGQ